MVRFTELLRSLNNLRLLAVIGRSGGDLASIGDLVDNLLGSPLMAECVRRFRALPGGSALMDSRYPPLQPDIEAMLQLPEASLGYRYGRLIRDLGYDPEFFRPRPTDSDELWLTQRIATTHDIHHVVAGFGTSPVGEVGVLAITAVQIGFPAYVLLTGAAQLGSFRFQPERYQDLSRAYAHGAAIGLEANGLAAVAWEEGWDRPVAAWREQLGIRRPADREPYGLDGDRRLD
ncbi:MAG: Coq4 family protein [Cyanobacteriota bacterium]|nr:Coq4 family protein [Cyanobacteriota bacterium]